MHALPRVTWGKAIFFLQGMVHSNHKKFIRLRILVLMAMPWDNRELGENPKQSCCRNNVTFLLTTGSLSFWEGERGCMLMQRLSRKTCQFSARELTGYKV